MSTVDRRIGNNARKSWLRIGEAIDHYVQGRRYVSHGHPVPARLSKRKRKFFLLGVRLEAKRCRLGLSRRTGLPMEPRLRKVTPIGPSKRALLEILVAGRKESSNGESSRSGHEGPYSEKET